MTDLIAQLRAELVAKEAEVVELQECLMRHVAALSTAELSLARCQDALREVGLGEAPATEEGMRVGDTITIPSDEVIAGPDIPPGTYTVTKVYGRVRE